MPITKWYKEWWKDLPPEKKAAAELLGWTKELWDTDKETDISNENDWDDLTDEQKKAAGEIGYVKETWDRDQDSSDSSSSSSSSSEEES
mmetsp:Transcript_5832/g.10112  ORF Transcript_5832/g.10112 Transcript_5832/m.10112 type:complete len:89 (-) Transcript_5832:311-577(-)|eukprot:CAMPEP_0197433572 /NCGR_PEP_ID=MMETSP1175-20131217/1437_1 /TAXON_ID=1003142 /ORGANISM="Triceratium dubium, Strain CCMP147" /LENGTH=88 /DNA_ID=CAMNT_0042961999 /DNA_START=162 /DNA_END=428 /DNA_ORIENTATION=-